MEKELDLPSAATELLSYVAKNAFDPLEALAERQLPLRAETRTVEHHGCRYLVRLSRIKARAAPPGTREMYLLSVMKLEGIRVDGGVAPSEEEAAEIARAFFPGGYMECPGEMDLLNINRKYIALK